MRLQDLSRFRDPREAWRRLVLYSKRIQPFLRWQDAAGFSPVWEIAKTRTLVDEMRAHTLYQFARYASKLEGDFAEIGVYRGGTAKLLLHVVEGSDRKVHLFDTFAGMPKSDERDLHTEGDFNDTSLDAVRGFLSPARNAAFYAGEFPKTAEGLENKRFAFVHVDVDIARSVEACCEFFYPRMVAGGVMVFDDYGATSCPGAKLAADAFFASRPETLMHLATTQAMVIKLPSSS